MLEAISRVDRSRQWALAALALAALGLLGSLFSAGLARVVLECSRDGRVEALLVSADDERSTREDARADFDSRQGESEPKEQSGDDEQDDEESEAQAWAAGWDAGSLQAVTKYALLFADGAPVDRSPPASCELDPETPPPRG